MVFTDEDGKLLSDVLLEQCTRSGWRAHYIVTVESHVHLLVSWPDPATDVDVVYTRLKQGCGYRLAQHFGTRGRPYFSRGGGQDRKRVRNDIHFRHLVNQYVREHKGYTWRESQATGFGPFVWERGEADAEGRPAG